MDASAPSVQSHQTPVPQRGRMASSTSLRGDPCPGSQPGCCCGNALTGSTHQSGGGGMQSSSL
eukprot:3296839-Amphidinium_carterae.1